jgi:hypothetical protein
MRRRYKVAAVSLALLAAAVVAAWFERQSIATYAIDRTLRQHNVPAQYRIVSVGPGVQRLADIRIGDPQHPDLVARQIDATIGWWFGGPRVIRLVARGVRIFGHVAGGKLSLGALDRLMPAPSGGPFALPDIAVDLEDVGIRLNTPAGAIGMTVIGRGNLASGFSGRVAAVATDLTIGGCAIARPSAWLAVTTADRSPHLAGPVRFARLACPGRNLAINGGALLPSVTLAPALDGWQGEAGLSLNQPSMAGSSARSVSGRVGFSGNAEATRGTIDLVLAAPQRADWHAAHATTALRYAIGKDRWSIDGQLGAEHAAIPQNLVAGWAQKLSATPLGPLALAVGQGAQLAARNLSGKVGLLMQSGGGSQLLRVTLLDLTSASGGRLKLGGGRGLAISWPNGAISIDGAVSLVGGGLPGIHAALAQDGSGSITLDPYAAGGIRLAMDPVVITAQGGGARRVMTRLRFDGPLGGGRIQGLDLPVALQIGPGGRFALDGGCTAIAFSRLDIVGARLGASRLNACASGPALFARDGNGLITGGAVIAAPRLTGQLGDKPLILAARALRLSPGDFTLTGLDVRLAPATRLTLDQLGGQFAALTGRYAGAAGMLSNVPLRLAAGQGSWRWAGGMLALDGQGRLSDAADPPRFNPLTVKGIDLRLSGGRIALAADLDEPKTGRKISRLTLSHDLSSGKGQAKLDVTGLRFDKDLQPDTLTRLTLGVIANVRGAVSGEGRINWSSAGVASDGDFTTDSVDLAAAFGNVTALKGKIHFDDLLALTTPAGQEVALGQVNPGVPVNDGTIRFRLLADQRVAVEGGRWPFAGGALVLQPTVLDFGRPSARHFTFRVEGLDAAQFIQTLDLSNVAATGLFDGTLPMVFDDKGGRIEHGRLISRPGGGTLAYVGQISQANIGSAGKLAFDALKSMRYTALTIGLDGDLDGEIVSDIAFAGVNQTPVELGGGSKLLPGMTGVPFRFNIKVKAPFRGLLNTAKSFGDVGATVRSALPPVQPPAITAP